MSFRIRYLKHLPHKGEIIIAPKIGASMCGKWFKEFNYMVIEGLA
jgi:hypothetical protein